MQLDPPLFASLRRLHSEFIQAGTPRSRAVGAAARALGVLPITDDWEHDFGIRITDGEVLEFNREPPHDPQVVREGRRKLAILNIARFRLPELKGLIPPRPEGAVDCEGCGGAGELVRGDGEMMECRWCVCGWVPPAWDAYSI